MFTHVLTLFDFNAYEAMIFHLWRHESNRFFFLLIYSMHLHRLY